MSLAGLKPAWGLPRDPVRALKTRDHEGDILPEKQTAPVYPTAVKISLR